MGDRLVFEGSVREKDKSYRIGFFSYQCQQGRIQLVLQGDSLADKEIATDLANACLAEGTVMYLGTLLGDRLALQFEWPDINPNHLDRIWLIRPSCN